MGELSPPTAVTEGAAAENALVFSPLRPCGAPPPKGEAREKRRKGCRGERRRDVGIPPYEMSRRSWENKKKEGIKSPLCAMHFQR